MPEQELNLLKLTAAVVAQLRAGSPQVVRCNVLQTCPLAAALTTYQTTFCEMPLPHTFPVLGDGTEDSSLPNASRSCPLIESRL